MRLWTRVHLFKALPLEGGVLEQPERMMQALEILAHEWELDRKARDERARIAASHPGANVYSYRRKGA